MNIRKILYRTTIAKKGNPKMFGEVKSLHYTCDTS